MLQLRAKNMPLRSEYIFPHSERRRAPTAWSIGIRLSSRSAFSQPARRTTLHCAFAITERGRRVREGKCRFREIYLNRRGQLDSTLEGRAKRERGRGEGTCVRNGLVNCFKRRHSIFNFENNSRRQSGICESERGVLSSPGRAQRVDLGTDKSVHCSLSVYRVAQIFCSGGLRGCGDSVRSFILASKATQ